METRPTGVATQIVQTTVITIDSDVFLTVQPNLRRLKAQREHPQGVPLQVWGRVRGDWFDSIRDY